VAAIDWRVSTCRTRSAALQVREAGDPSHPTVVLVHGYPDASVVWDAGTVSVMADGPTTPIAGEPIGASTLLEVLEQLRTKGFDRDMFITADAMVRCGSCHHDMAPTELNLLHLVRLEGVSDPSEEAAVLALECTMCNARGTAVVRFGPEASPQDDAVLLAVSDHR
jgi:hypothetical protein